MTSWSEYVHYACDDCGAICINHTDTEAARFDLCHSCFNDIPEAVLNSATSERAEGAAPSHGGPTDRESARPRAERRGQSQRESPAEGPERGDAVRSLSNAVDSSAKFDE